MARYILMRLGGLIPVLFVLSLARFRATLAKMA